MDFTVNIEIAFDKKADMETIIKMGFQEGFTAGLDNLDNYLSTHKACSKYYYCTNNLQHF